MFTGRLKSEIPLALVSGSPKKTDLFDGISVQVLLCCEI